MNKRSYHIGISLCLIGLFALVAEPFTQGGASTLLGAIATSGLLVGCIDLARTFYWRREKNAPRYAERLEAQQINLHDELKEQLRNQAGRLTFIITLMILFCAAIVLSILSLMGMQHLAPLSMSLLLLCFFLYHLGNFIYRRLLKKYE